ncbi:Down syndrome critical region protein 3 homolog [Diaphorina citri]|uniref:Down syndrome critical region protein 3 homolog n=1 Tax=Diaphorina citri TaxID=121845 RepID=A0A3Q0J0R9_DIACI|nr:Down syndrome critical region protein 3 homolog [Diaphorina citri]
MIMKYIVLTIEGSVNLTLSSKTVGVFEALYNSAKPIQLLSIELELAAAGKMPSGTTQIPFEAMKKMSSYCRSKELSS